MGAWPRVSGGAWPRFSMGVGPGSVWGGGPGSAWGGAAMLLDEMLLWILESWDHAVLQPTAELCVSRVVHCVWKPV